jgi:hypothetical protein
MVGSESVMWDLVCTGYKEHTKEIAHVYPISLVND